MMTFLKQNLRQELEMHQIKISTKADKPASKQQDALTEIMSDSKRNRAVPPKKQNQSRSKGKSLCAKKTRNKSKKQKDDVSGPDVALIHYRRFLIHVAVLSLLTFLIVDVLALGF